MTLSQLETLLKEASMEYIRNGRNYAEIEHYARLLREAIDKETLRQLEGDAEGFCGK